MEKITKLLEVIAPFIVAVTALISAINSSKANKKMENVTKEVKELGSATKEALRDVLRNDITNLYYKRIKYKYLFQYERESLDKMFAGYTDMGGNNFVHDIYEEMRTWEVRKG